MKTTSKNAAVKPTTATASTPKPAAAATPTVAKPTTAKPVGAKPATRRRTSTQNSSRTSAPKPAAAKPAAPKPVVANPAVAKPAAEPVVAKVETPAAPARPVVIRPAVAVVVEPAADTAHAGKGKKKSAEKKPKLVRDSFTMPEREYVQIAALKQRVLGMGQEVKKSELLRAGLAALTKMTDSQLKDALAGLEKIKTGRPAK